MLKQKARAAGKGHPRYSVLEITQNGELQKRFRVGVFLRGEMIAEADSSEQPRAEKKAALLALQKLGWIKQS